jgi:hypothetical protein
VLTVYFVLSQVIGLVCHLHRRNRRVAPVRADIALSPT